MHLFVSQQKNSSISLPLPSSLETEATNGRPSDARSEPATPLQRPADTAFEVSAPAVLACQPTKTKKFAKTLRLTSDQLVSEDFCIASID